jgi:hypothetical protein
MAIKAFAPQRHQQDGSNIGMGAKTCHHARGISIGITSAKADQVYSTLLKRIGNGTGHMVGAFHQVTHGNVIPYAFASVFAKISL